MNEFARRLIILQGDDKSIINQLEDVTTTLSGDWITISEDRQLNHLMIQSYPNKQAKLLLGREFKHGIFDARQGFNLDALAILAGTLVAESLLILLLPNDFNDWSDEDSLRWSELPQAQLVPNFIAHLNFVIKEQEKQYSNCFLRLFIKPQCDAHLLLNLINKDYLPARTTEKLTYYQTQQHLLEHITQLDRRIILITAKRGRGKSTLAGNFAQHHHCWITGPNKKAVTTLMKFAPLGTQFFAPDEILSCSLSKNSKPDWLIIDEAAMIPLSMVEALIKHFKHILLTSTTDGYEGTGQGLLLKLISRFNPNDVAHFQLHMPIRWQENDPLEYFIDNLILANLSQTPRKKVNVKAEISQLKQVELVQSPETLATFFGLLKTAHYRTTLIDLRRLLDAPNLLLYRAQFDECNIVGILVAIREGGLDPELAEQILQGYRRPKGNLVAQSLVAHAGEPNAAILRSIRVNRIAVSEVYRRQGVATELITHLVEQSKLDGYDFISASFAYSQEMCQFWLACGFNIVHVGTHKEASSGNYAVMAMYPISTAAKDLMNVMQRKVARNWYWLRSLIKINLPIQVIYEQQLNVHDWDELTLFSTTSYSYFASIAVLYRLINWLKDNSKDSLSQLPILHCLVENQFSDKITIHYFKLSGKNELLKLLRQEIYHFIRMQGFINE